MTDAGSTQRDDESPREVGLSFIIPAFNEEDMLPRTLASIRRHLPEQFSSQIIVVDNGSSDRTMSIASELSDVVTCRPRASVGELRNVGAALADFPILVFLDADTELTDAWGGAIAGSVELLMNQPMTVTGSRCTSPGNNTWIERVWFDRNPDRGQPSYVNSGHLLTTSMLFSTLRGFDPRLETGEDVDFSERARLAGAVIDPQPELLVFHHGYPTTVSEFFGRECWHGRGDYASLAKFLSSKVVWASVTFVLLHLLVLIAALAGKPVVAGGGGVAVLSVCVALPVVALGRRRLRTIAGAAVLAYVYLWARACSPLCYSTRGARQWGSPTPQDP